VELIVGLVAGLIASITALFAVVNKSAKHKEKARDAELEQREAIDRHDKITANSNDADERDRVRNVYTRHDTK
jgi:flagellar basal body-associated protein FliL